MVAVAAALLGSYAAYRGARIARCMSDRRRSVAAIREHAKHLYVAALGLFACAFLMHWISYLTMVALFLASYLGWRLIATRTLDGYNSG
jgi:dolichyl-phosphate-mannose--protein O-mannosyl transferase